MSKNKNHAEPLEVAQAADVLAQLDAVNLDEVTAEILRVRVHDFKLVPVLDEEGNPLVDEEGNPRMRRKLVPRIAEIYNFVSLPVYNKVIAARSQLEGKLNEAELVAKMGDLVWEVWKQSEPEPFMTRERFYETVSGDTILALISRFFNRSLLGLKDKA